MKLKNRLLNNKKGTTLVEVVVSIAVFLIVFGGLVTSYFALNKMVLKQKEFVYFEAVCLDIHEYSNVYKKEWDKYYFNLDMAESNSVIYYDGNFNITKNISKYKLSYQYNEQGELIVNIENMEKGYYIIENLNYGSGRYV